uniref:Uncharacterized protein n=1 Tax=Magallana gigas TaxID=29159 RepID=A0A8W8NY15_MAGGI
MRKSTNKVVDAYLAYLVQAEIEKGNKITIYPSQTMTAIVDGSFTIKGCKKKLKLFECSTVIGEVVRHGHCTLLAGQEKNCKELQKWSKDEVNHFWYVCKAANNMDEFLGMWAGGSCHTVTVVSVLMHMILCWTQQVTTCG